MAFTLRPYQSELLSQLQDITKVQRANPCAVMPTGSGKSVVIGKLTRHFVEQGLNVHLWVHRTRLVNQLSETIRLEGFNPGVIQGNKSGNYGPVQVASVQSLINRDKSSYLNPDVVIVDENHHVASGNTYSNLLDRLKPRNAIGFTATPCRLDGKGLGDFYTDLVEGPQAKWLIENGFLSPFTMLACKSALEGASSKVRKGDFVSSELWDQLDSSVLNGELVRDYKKHIPGKKCITFTMNKTHAEQVVEAYEAAGVPSMSILDHHSDERRKEAFDAFVSGKIRVLVNVNILTEGVDLPGVDAVQIAFKTKSITKWLQAIGRALRPSPGKTMAYILDHGGNCFNPALPWPNSNIHWSLEESPIILKDEEVEVKDLETDQILKIPAEEFSLTELGDELEVIDLEAVQQAHSQKIIEDQKNSFDMHYETSLLTRKKPISAFYRTLEQYKGILGEETLKYIAKKLGYHHKWVKHQLTAMNKKVEF